MTTTYETEWISCADTAKLVRAKLKQAFPAIKFSVRSDSYAGGASIRVSWTDGPTEDEFDRVVGIFAGRAFDGMIDLATSNYAWMLPDGTVTFAGTPGTEGSMGTIARSACPRPMADAKRVHFGSNYVNGSRHYTRAFMERIAAQVAREYGKPIPPVVQSGDSHYVESLYERIGGGYDTLDRLIHREAHKTSAL